MKEIEDGENWSYCQSTDWATIHVHKKTGISRIAINHNGFNKIHYVLNAVGYKIIEESHNAITKDNRRVQFLTMAAGLVFLGTIILPFDYAITYCEPIAEMRMRSAAEEFDFYIYEEGSKRIVEKMECSNQESLLKIVDFLLEKMKRKLT